MVQENPAPQEQEKRTQQDKPQAEETSIAVHASRNIGPQVFLGGIVIGLIGILTAFLMLGWPSVLFAGLVIIGFGVLCYHGVPALHNESIDILNFPIPHIHFGHGPTFVIPGLVRTMQASEEDQPLDIRYAPPGQERRPEDDKTGDESVFLTSSLATYCKDIRNIIVVREVQVRFRIVNPYLYRRIGKKESKRAMYAVVIDRLANEIRGKTLKQCLKANTKRDLVDALEEEFDHKIKQWGIDITSVSVADPGQLPETEAARQLSAEAQNLQTQLSITAEEATLVALTNRGKAGMHKNIFDIGGRLGQIIKEIIPALAAKGQNRKDSEPKRDDQT